MQRYWGSEPGSMLVLQASPTTVNEILQPLNSERRDLYSEVASYNGFESDVVVGSGEAIDFLQQHVANTAQFHEIRIKKLIVTNGFHSQFTETLLRHLEGLSKLFEWKQPDIHLETTEELESKTEPDFHLVSEHTRRPVFFQRAIGTLTTKFLNYTWIEAGRGSSILSLVKLSVADLQGHIFLSPPLTSAYAQDALKDITIDLWKIGYVTKYWPYYRIQKPDSEHISLPPIQFEKTRHWLSFTGRGSKNDEPEAVQDTEETHELLTFLNFTDGAKSEAVFQIDPQSERFKTMLGGHVMAGESLAPASLCFEVVARAALLLENDTEVKVYVLTVDDLLTKSRIGQSTNKTTLLILKKVNDARPTWSFTVTTKVMDVSTEHPFEHSIGSICLKKRNDAQAARGIRAY